MSRPILHHYALSPFAEMVRVMFGIKRLAWQAVEAPMVMPKPDLLALTGGYRRVPVLQFGADVYCDTALIARELDRRFPEAPLLPPGQAGQAEAVREWAGRTLFWHAGRFAIGTVPEAFPESFHADRAAMWGVPVDIDRMRRSAPRYRARLQAQLPWIEDMVTSRPFVLGAAPTAADSAVYGACWFLRQLGPRVGEVLAPHAAVGRWMDRVAAIGHGTPHPIEAAAALRAAADAAPAFVAGRQAGGASDPPLGSTVAVSPDDYARDAVVGELAALDADHVALRRDTPDLGAVVVHFPRLGYALRSAS